MQNKSAGTAPDGPFYFIYHFSFRRSSQTQPLTSFRLTSLTGFLYHPFLVGIALRVVVDVVAEYGGTFFCVSTR